MVFAFDAWRKAVEMFYYVAHRSVPADQRESTVFELMELILQYMNGAELKHLSTTVFLLSQTLLCLASKLRSVRSFADYSTTGPVQMFNMHRTLSVLQLCARVVSFTNSPEGLQTRFNLYAAMFYLLKTVVIPRSYRQSIARTAAMSRQPAESVGDWDLVSQSEEQRKKLDERERWFVQVVTSQFVAERTPFLDVLWRDSVEGTDILRPVALDLLCYLQELLVLAQSKTVLLETP